jgi:hypothetical protein
MKPSWLLILSLLAVILIFHICYGLEILVPTNVSWLMTAMHDWGTHYLGWYFYRNESWHFPLGKVYTYFYPIGTNVGFTDSIPLFAIVFKIFAPILPEDFQYFGIFLFLCHLLTAYYTIRLLQNFQVRPLYIFLGVVFMAANPVLIYRGLHPALCAHWLIIACVYVYFLDPVYIKAQRILIYQCVLLVISGLINPYLCFMVLGFSFFTALKLWLYDKSITLFVFFSYQIGSVFFLLFTWFIIGMITIGSKEDLGVSGGYGLYSLNLNSLYNPSGFSKLLPALKQVSWHQYEGYMYLGAGIFFLLIGLLLYKLYAILVKKEREVTLKVNSRKLIPLGILVIIFTLFSITHIVSINDSILFKIPIPSEVIKFGEIFRASARFFWLPYYLIFLFVIATLARCNLPSFMKIGLLSLGLLIQLYDITPLMTHRNLSYGTYIPPIDQRWYKIIKHFDEIRFYPPFQATYQTDLDYQYFSYLAAKARKPINIGYVARADNNAILAFTDSINSDLLTDNVSPHILYVTTTPYLKNFSYLLQAGAVQLHEMNNYFYLFDESNKSPDLVSLTEESDKKRVDSVRASIHSLPEFTKTSTIQADSTSTIDFNIESFSDKDKFVSINGWAFVKNTDNNRGDSVFIFLKSQENSFIAKPDKFLRPDVTGYFKKSYLDDAGFNGLILKKRLPKGNYQMGIAIKDKQGQWRYQLSDKLVVVGAPFASIKPYSNSLPTGDIMYGIDQFQNQKNFIHMAGWAALKDQNADNSTILLVLKKEDNTMFVCDTEQPVLRTDVTAHFNNKFNLDKSGFSCRLSKSSLPAGKYQFGIWIKKNNVNKDGVIWTDKTIEIIP